MKMNLSREQAIFLGVGAFLFLGALGLAWFALGGLSEELSRAQQITDRKGSGDLAAILNRAGGISAARKDIQEITKLSQELEKHEEMMIGPWRKGWEEASGVGMDWSKDPGKWKDRLVMDNDEILKNCGRKGDLSSVTLGDNFYLGFEEFKQKSPTAEQVPALARQLSVAKKLVDLLLAAKKTREGYATPCVLLGLEVPVGGGAPNPETAKTSKRVDDKSAEMVRERYRLRLACSPEVLFEFVQLLNQDPWLFIITNLRLTNEKEIFPKRGEIAKLFEAESADVSGAQDQDASRGSGKASGKAKLLLVLSGKERVEVNLDLDYVGWKGPSLSAKSPELKK